MYRMLSALSVCSHSSGSEMGIQWDSDERRRCSIRLVCYHMQWEIKTSTKGACLNCLYAPGSERYLWWMGIMGECFWCLAVNCVVFAKIICVFDRSILRRLGEGKTR